MDIFCQIQTKLTNQVLYQSQNFYILHDGYPLVEGHLLLIPKNHFRCILEVLDNNSLKKEYFKVLNMCHSFLTKYYLEPVYFEHGNYAQTVKHAHMQILPTRISLLKELEKLSGLPKPTKPYSYLYYGERGKNYYFNPVNKKLEPGFLHSTYARLLNRPVFGKERQPELHSWLAKTKVKFNQFLSLNA